MLVVIWALRLKSFKTSIKEGDEDAAQQNKVEQAADGSASTGSNTESVKKEDKV